MPIKYWQLQLWTVRSSELIHLSFITIHIFLSFDSVSGKYVPQGKLGCALLGLHSTRDVS